MLQEAGSVLKRVYVLASDSALQLAQTCHMNIDFGGKGTMRVKKKEKKRRERERERKKREEKRERKAYLEVGVLLDNIVLSQHTHGPGLDTQHAVRMHTYPFGNQSTSLNIPERGSAD